MPISGNLKNGYNPLMAGRDPFFLFTHENNVDPV